MNSKQKEISLIYLWKIGNYKKCKCVMYFTKVSKHNSITKALQKYPR